MKKQYIYYAVGGLVVITALSIAIPYVVKKVKKSTGDGKAGDLDKGGSDIVDKNLELVDTYVNIRSSPKVDNKNYCNDYTGLGYDCTDNIIEKRTSNNVGVIMETLKSDKYFWYKIGIGGNKSNIGYVREDAVKVVK